MSKFFKVAAVGAAVAAAMSVVCFKAPESGVNYYKTVNSTGYLTGHDISLKNNVETSSITLPASVVPKKEDVNPHSCEGSSCQVPAVVKEQIKMQHISNTVAEPHIISNKDIVKPEGLGLTGEKGVLPESVVVRGLVAKSDESKESSASLPKEKMKTEEVRSNDTFLSTCRRLGVNSNDLTDMVYGGGLRDSAFTVKPKQLVDAIFEDSGALKEIRIHASDAIEYRSIYKSEGKYRVKKKEYPHHVATISKEFTLAGGLFKTAKDAGLNENETAKLHLILKDRVDFKKLAADAKIKVKLEQTIINGHVNSFNYKFIEVVSSTYNLKAYNYKGNFYDVDGESLSPSFLRHPLEGKVRVTSHFNRHRMHPILHIVRPHWGTDYGVPIGTKILSISDATVLRAGKARGFGNRVILKHPGNITTTAAHMLRIAKGIKPGVKVKKGQVIGYVGKTGLSTGPHLHFEMRVDGKRVDSLKAKLPVASNVSKDKEFRELIAG